MKKVLVLGAGLVAGPLVNYLLEKTDFKVIVASRTKEKAVNLVNNHPSGEAKQLLVDDDEHLEELVQNSDLAVSLLPYIYHVKVAKLCIKHKKHLVTTSYVSKEMAELGKAAKDAGILLLNEIGLDPGIDHMSAQKIIDEVHEKGGKILSFESLCGGLPAPDCNDNPYGYKFSWSPRGVLLAGKNTARFLKDEKVVDVTGNTLFDYNWPKEIPGLGMLEMYPNRDSIPYVETYSIPETKTMFRGTLRNPGWCTTLKKIVELDFLEIEEKDWTGKTYADLMKERIKADSTENIKTKTAKYLNISEDSKEIANLEWLDLFSDKELPIKKGGIIDILTETMLDKMDYKSGEKDMIVLQHEFIAEYDSKKEKIISSLIDFGIPNGPSSMSRTVGLPAAIGTRFILEGKINITGCHIPVAKEVYNPVLEELENLGIICKEIKKEI